MFSLPHIRLRTIVLFIGSFFLINTAIAENIELTPKQIEAIQAFAENHICQGENYTIVDAMQHRKSCFAADTLISLYAHEIARFDWSAKEMIGLAKGEPIVLFQPDIRSLPSIGSDNAQLAIVEFTDPQCPFCTNYANNAFHQIKKDYIDTGKVKYFYSHVPLTFHPDAFLAVEANYCAAEQDAYYDYHVLLMQDVRKIKRRYLDGYANQLGLDATQFQQCIDTHRYKEKVQKELDVRKVAGPTSFPFFVIGTLVDGVFEAKILASERAFETVNRSLIDNAIHKIQDSKSTVATQ